MSVAVDGDRWLSPDPTSEGLLPSHHKTYKGTITPGISSVKNLTSSFHQHSFTVVPFDVLVIAEVLSVLFAFLGYCQFLLATQP